MAVGYTEIDRVIQRARGRHARIAAATGLLRAVAQGVGCLLGGSLGVAIGGRIGFARVATLLGITAALVLEGVRLFRALRAAREPAFVARLLASGDAPLLSSLVSAVELERDREEIRRSGRFSLALVDGHVERSAQALARVDVAAAIPALPARRAAAALGAVAGVTLLAIVASGSMAGSVRRLIVGDPVTVRLALDPITGDVELTFRYPAYMRREPKLLSGTGGEIRAPKGTEVALRTRADRPVKGAELEVELAEAAPLSPPPVGERGKSPSPAPRERDRAKISLQISGDRELSGRFLVEGAGSYRFRFLNGRGRTVAEGAPIPISIEPDAFPEVQITAPAQEVELQPGASVKVEWQAQDDIGLAELALVLKPPGGTERRRPLRRFDGARREAGAFDLELAPLGLGEGDRLLYWLEATDGDAVSGPKKGASATHVVKIYSEAEHRRRLMEEVRAAWEELVGVLGDHLELGARGQLQAPTVLPLAAALDARVKKSHQRLRDVAGEIRKDRAGPKELARGLENVAATLRIAEQRVSSTRQALARFVREGRPPDPGLVSMVRAFDEQLDSELERGVLYIEQLLDRRAAEDLVKMARDLAQARRDLADLLDRYRRAPSDDAKRELVARISRMKDRMNELMSRMAEQAKGLSDEHMNRDALAELAKSENVAAGLDSVEKALARGDIEAAMKALDEMGSTMQQMLAGLERTAWMPSEKNRELAKELRAFKRELDGLRSDQQKLGAETEQLREAWRQRMGERLKEAERAAARLERLAKEAGDAERAAEKGAPRRAQVDLESAQDALENLKRALAARDPQAALDAARMALGPASRTAMILEEEAQIAERYQQSGRTDAAQARDAQRQAQAALQKTDEVRKELEKLLPDPSQLLSKEEKQRLGQQGQRQQGLDQRAGGLQERLSQLQEKAPIFPPSAAGAIGEARGHMGQAAGELRGGNVQRGRSEQAAAQEGLDRFAKGLEQMAKGGGGGDGFPLPFGAEGMGSESGEGEEPSPEKVEIPGAEAWRAPAEFRKELLDAMKQGTPERYEGEVKRYYEELVK
jgi:hypothetical protein